MKKNEITQERLKELLNYNLSTGIFTWRINRTAAKKGNEAGWEDNSCSVLYRRIQVDGEIYRSHRLAWFYMTGSWPENEIDHINHDGTDNRWINLRSVTHATNTRNARRGKDNKSGITGVHWHAKKKAWIATIGAKNKHLIHTSDFFEACCRRKSAERKYDFHINHGAVI